MKCGSEHVFIAKDPIITSTTDYFSSPGICLYKLRTYESNDLVRLNVTFTRIKNAQTHLIYKKIGSSSYTEELDELAERENYTFSIRRDNLDESDKVIYVVVKALSSSASEVIF